MIILGDRQFLANIVNYTQEVFLCIPLSIEDAVDQKIITR